MTEPEPDTADAPWRHILADTPDALIFADKGGLIRAWNAGAEAVFGFSAAEAIGQSLDLIIPERLRAAHWLGFNRAMARGTTSYGAEVRTTRGAHKDGRKLYVDMSFGVVKDDAGAVLGSVAMARDVTERHLAAVATRSDAPKAPDRRSEYPPATQHLSATNARPASASLQTQDPITVTRSRRSRRIGHTYKCAHRCQPAVTSGSSRLAGL